MKLKDLVGKVDDLNILFINGKEYEENLVKENLEKEIKKINIEIEKKQDLESLGYSFEVGV